MGQLVPAVFSAPVRVDGQTYPENVDAATIDHFISVVQASGTVLTDKTFVSGWSNGSAMSYLMRSTVPRGLDRSLSGARSI